MALIIPEGYGFASIRLDSTMFTDGYALITGGYHLPTGGGVADLCVAIAQALQDSEIQNPLSSAITITRVDAVTETSSGAATLTITGSNSNQMPPSNSAVLVNKRTATRGRRARGRNFWPGLVQEGAVDARGVIESGVVDTLQSVFDDFQESLDLAGAFPVILQNEEGNTAPISPPPQVTRFVVDAQFASQRRRMRR